MDNSGLPKTPANQVGQPKLEHNSELEGQSVSTQASNQVIPDTNQPQLSFQLPSQNPRQAGPPQTNAPQLNPQADAALSVGQKVDVTSNDNKQTIYNSQLESSLAMQIQASPQIKPLLTPDPVSPNELNSSKTNEKTMSTNIPNKPEQQSQIQPSSPQKAAVTKVKLTDELNVFDWLRTKDIILQIAEKAKNSVDSVITVLDPGMKEYLYSGGNINIVVVSDSKFLVSPIRDAFQDVFGRATVSAARYKSPQVNDDYPIKLASGFNEAIIVAKERIKKFRLDTDNIPQNQVILVVQPTVVTVRSNETKGLTIDDNLQLEWFLTFCMVIEDPVLAATMYSFAQFIPIDSDIIVKLKEAKLSTEFAQSSLGFAQSISDFMTKRLGLALDESNDEKSSWLEIWSGLDEERVIHDLSTSLAHMYRRKWNDCVVG